MKSSSSIRGAAGAIAALALIAASTSAAAADTSAAKLSLSNSKAVRAATGTRSASHQAGGFPFLIVFVVVAAGLGLYFAVDGGDDDQPTSA